MKKDIKRKAILVPVIALATFLICQHVFPLLLWATGLTTQCFVITIFVALLLLCCILIYFKKNSCIAWGIGLGAIGSMIIFDGTSSEGKFYKDFFFAHKGLIDKWGRIVIDYDDEGLQDFYYCVGNNGEEFLIKNDLIEEKMKFYNIKGEWFYSIKYELTEDDSNERTRGFISKYYGTTVWNYNCARADSDVFFTSDYIIIKETEGIWDNRIANINKAETGKRTNDYTDLGPIDCYISDLHDDHIANDIKNIHLYAKSYEGKSLYFIKSKYDKDNYRPLTKGSWTRSNIRFNARCSLGSNIFYYVNVSLWDSSGSSSNGSSSGSVSTDRGLQPVQEWVPCPVCGNSLKVGLCQHCNGTGQDLYYTRSYRDCPNCGGMKKCPACGGNGGHYETRYR